MLHIINIRIFSIKEGRYPTEEEIARVLRYYEKNKDEIESEMTPMILKFRKGRVTYVVDKNGQMYGVGEISAYNYLGIDYIQEYDTTYRPQKTDIKISFDL